ncbi:XdhC family protein [Marinomonas sp.]
MQHLDLQVIEQALKWSKKGHSVWLCTVLRTFGSSPREPGAMMAACEQGDFIGSLSGGCVEDDFLLRLKEGEFTCFSQILRYGVQASDAKKATVALPCGGQLDVLVERFPCNEDSLQHFSTLLESLLGQQNIVRYIDLSRQKRELSDTTLPASTVEYDETKQQVTVCYGPTSRLIIAGFSTVAVFCAQYAKMLGYEVILCEHREDSLIDFAVEGVRVEPSFPADFIYQANNVHANTAIVALTHDPRIDDLAMIDAVKTSAFYIGVMGSKRTSEKRAERLKRIGGLSGEALARIHMPIGLNLGSKTPAEIALAVMADIVRVQKGATPLVT